MRILFVAMADSVHTARWIGQLRQEGWDLHLFPCEDGNVHPSLCEVTIHPLLRQRRSDIHPSVRQTGLWWPFRRGRTRVTQLIRGRFVSRAAMLARTIQKLTPDILHTLEMQRAGYLTLDARNMMNGDRFPFWVFSSWGSDIYHFGRQREHESRVRQVLGSCDLFIADCQRDSKLASQFGFRGCHQEVFPGGGGFEISRMQPFRQGLPSRRRLIAVKGYHGGAWGGRALVALEALRLCADALRDYCIVVFSAHGNRQVCSLAEELSRTLRLEIILMPPSPREEIIKLMGRTRISLGLGITDGTPNAMLEAMIMGAFPIQSDTISTAEWIDHGRNGFLVPPEDPVVVAGAIRSAIVDDALVDRAAELNDGLTRDKVDVNIIKPQVIEMYRRVAKWKVRRDSSEQRGLCASW